MLDNIGKMSSNYLTKQKEVEKVETGQKRRHLRPPRSDVVPMVSGLIVQGQDIVALPGNFILLLSKIPEGYWYSLTVIKYLNIFSREGQP